MSSGLDCDISTGGATSSYQQVEGEFEFLENVHKLHFWWGLGSHGQHAVTHVLLL